MFREVLNGVTDEAWVVVDLYLASPAVGDARLHWCGVWSEDGGETWEYRLNLNPDPDNEVDECLLTGDGFASVGAAAGAALDAYYERWLPHAAVYTREMNNRAAYAIDVDKLPAL